MARSAACRTDGLLRAAAFLLAGTLAACGEPEVPPERVRERLAAIERPNLVLVVVDTLRADWLSAYGDPAATSPEIQRWAARGVLFERARAQSSWTKTSMASLMTSLWPQSHGVALQDDGLAPGAVTLAEVLREGGYRTYGVQSNGWLEQTFGFQQGFDRYVFPRGGRDAAHRSSVWPHGDNIYREVRRLLDAHPEETPFFLYVHLMDVHEYAAPPEFHRFGSDDEGAYRAAVRWTDDVVERLRKRLDSLGLLEGTVMVLASDHGETFGEDGTHGHARNSKTPALEVPLVVRFPFPTPGIRVSAQVRNLDLAPTLVALAGRPAPESFQGRSLLPLLAEPGAAKDRTSFASLGERLYPDAVLQEAITDGSWTLVRDVGEEGGESLYDRRVDPDENVDLIGIERAPAARLRERLDAHLAAAPRAEAAEGAVRIDPQLKQKLRALGYAPAER